MTVWQNFEYTTQLLSEQVVDSLEAVCVNDALRALSALSLFPSSYHKRNANLIPAYQFRSSVSY